VPEPPQYGTGVLAQLELSTRLIRDDTRSDRSNDFLGDEIPHAVQPQIRLELRVAELQRRRV
jgi:hypothetical protein